MTCSRQEFVLVAIAVVLGIAVDSVGIASRGLWFDEAYTWLLSTYPVGEMLRRCVLDHSPPLHFLVVKGWTAVWGDGLLALRLLGVLWHVAAIALTYAFMRLVADWNGERDHHGDRRASYAAVLAAFLVATNVMQVSLAGEVRMYNQGVALSLLSSCLLPLLMRKPKLILAIAYGLSLGALLCTHNFGLFTFASHVACAGILIYSRFRTVGLADFNVGLMPLLLGWAIAAALYSPWLPALFQQWGSVQEAFWIPPFSLDSLAETVGKLFLQPRDSAALPLGTAYVVSIGVVAILSAVLFGGRVGDRAILALAAVPLLLAILVSAMGTSLLRPRYLAFSQVYMLCAVVAVMARTRSNVPFAITAVLLAVFQFGALAQYMRDARVWESGGGIQKIVALLHQKARSSDPVLFATPFVYVPALYHGGRPDPWFYSPTSSDTPKFLGPSALQAAMICDGECRKELAQRTDSVWLVEHDDGKAVVPWHWKRREEYRVPDDYVMQRTLILTRCEIQPEYLSEE